MKNYVLLFLMFITILCSSLAAQTIFQAARDGNFDRVQELLESDPALLNATDAEKYTALHWACIRGNWEVAGLLIDNGADLNAVGGDGGTPLQWAVHHDNVDIVKKMIRRGAQLNRQNQWGMTELHTAIWRGNINVVACLLDHGSDPMIRTKEGWTAMHYAYRSGHDNIIALLQQRGISTDVQDATGRYPRHLYFKKPNAILLPAEELADYTGKYYIGDYLMLDIWLENDRLKVMEFGPDELYPVARDFFYFKRAPWTLIFTRDDQGSIHHAQLSFIRRSYTIVKK